jgi:hypothetical protein
MGLSAFAPTRFQTLADARTARADYLHADFNPLPSEPDNGRGRMLPVFYRRYGE